MYSLIHSSYFVYEGLSLICKSTSNFYDTEALIKNNQTFVDLVSSSQETDYFIEDGLFAVGSVKNLNTPYTIIIGPFRIGEDVQGITDTVYRRHPNHFENLSKVKDALMSLPHLSLSQFFNLLSSIYIALNQQSVSKNVLSSDLQDEPLVESMSKNMAEKLVDDSFEAQERTHSIEYEKRLIYAVKNGLQDKIEELEHDPLIRKIESAYSNNLRSIKNMILTLNSICLRAAIDGGIDEETAYNLGDVFSKMIESITTVSSLRTTSNFVKQEYCKQVQRIKKHKIEDPIVLRAVRYIYSNLHKKISAKEIAKYVNVTPQYLSSRFAVAANISIPDFILRARISEAKQLLRFSNTSLNEISLILAFSSQSYFQTQFKKVVGITPLEYRNKKQYV